MTDNLHYRAWCLDLGERLGAYRAQPPDVWDSYLCLKLKQTALACVPPAGVVVEPDVHIHVHPVGIPPRLHCYVGIYPG